VSSRFYDAVVLGRSLGALTTAALLARRDFRVLVVGQGSRAPTYRFEQRPLCLGYRTGGQSLIRGLRNQVRKLFSDCHRAFLPRIRCARCVDL
jgi:choline dehydrogenase-like flavoprotein